MKGNQVQKEIGNNEMVSLITDQLDMMCLLIDTRTNELRSEIKADILELRTELKSDISELRTELKSVIAEFRLEFKSDLVDTKDELKSDIQSLQKYTNQRFFALKSI